MDQTAQLEQIIDNLIETLTVEKEYLLNGAYRELPSVTERKLYFSSLLDEYIASPDARYFAAPHKEKIHQIKQIADSNEVLLSATRSGVNSAITRLNKILHRENTVGTYTESGSKLDTHNVGVTRHKIA